MRKKISLLAFLFVFMITSGFGCDPKLTPPPKPITLEYWRVWDGEDAFEEVLRKYKEKHPYVTINYRKLRYNEYEQELLNALAEDRGPDIFSIHNTWVRKYQSKIATMPAEIKMTYPVVKGTLKKETFQETRINRSIPLKDIKNNFVDVVYDDVVIKTFNAETKQTEEKVYGLPLSVDTLAMYYNKDLMNVAGISTPPEHWNEYFQNAVSKMTRQNSQGEIEQAGAALGGGTNVARYSDIISVLMMQNGATMVDGSGQVLFDKRPENFSDRRYYPGLEAVRFYTDFANPSKTVYSWNQKMDNSLDLFIKGRVGFFFGYSYYIPQIKAQAPKLNYGIAKLPQIENSTNKVNFANYWVETVSNKSKNSAEAWDFIQYLSAKDQVKSYLTATNKPTALRSLVDSQLESKESGVFVEQVLTAKSWYKGNDPAAAESLLAEMIDTVVSGRDTLENAVGLAARKVQQTIK